MQLSEKREIHIGAASVLIIVVSHWIESVVSTLWVVNSDEKLYTVFFCHVIS